MKAWSLYYIFKGHSEAPETTRGEEAAAVDFQQRCEYLHGTPCRLRHLVCDRYGDVRDVTGPVTRRI